MLDESAFSIIHLEGTREKLLYRRLEDGFEISAQKSETADCPVAAVMLCNRKAAYLRTWFAEKR